MIKKIVIGSDHAGFLFKTKLKKHLENAGYQVIDVGTYEEKKSVDYPDVANKVCQYVLSETSMGVLICGSGIGMSIAANRYPGIRAALCWNAKVSKLSRAHNDANVLVIAERLISYRSAESSLDAFLTTSFQGGRHQCRVDKIEKF